MRYREDRSRKAIELHFGKTYSSQKRPDAGPDCFVTPSTTSHSMRVQQRTCFHCISYSARLILAFANAVRLGELSRRLMRAILVHFVTERTCRSSLGLLREHIIDTESDALQRFSQKPGCVLRGPASSRRAYRSSNVRQCKPSRRAGRDIIVGSRGADLARFRGSID